MTPLKPPGLRRPCLWWPPKGNYNQRARSCLLTGPHSYISLEASDFCVPRRFNFYSICVLTATPSMANFSFSMALLFHGLTFPWHHFSMASLFNGLTFSWPHFSIASLFHSLAFSWPHFSWPHFLMASLFHCLTFSWPHFSMASLFNGLTFPWPHFLMASLFHGLTF